MKTLIILFFISYYCSAQKNTSIHYSDPNIKELITIASTKNKTNKLSVYSIQIQANENPEKILKTKKSIYQNFRKKELMKYLKHLTLN